MKIFSCNKLAAFAPIVLPLVLLGGCSDSSSSPNTSDGQAQQDTGDSIGNDSGTDDSGGSSGSGNTGGDSGNNSGGDSGNSSGGDSGNGGSSGGGDSGGTVDPAACQSTTHLGQPFSTAQGSDSDPIFHSALAADGCLDAGSVWSGDSGDVLVLDTGTPQPMQGIYVWPRYNQLNWLEVSTSTDGSNWATEWQGIPTRPEQGPQYLSFKTPRSLRWVRLKGLKGQINDWVNISEVRWSLTGENVTTPKALRHDNNSEVTENTATRFDLSAWSIHPRLGITSSLAGFGMSHDNCGFRGQNFVNKSPTYIWTDLNGLQDTVFKRTDLPGNIVAFSYNFDLLSWPSDFNVGTYFYGDDKIASPKDGSTGRAETEIKNHWFSWVDDQVLTDEQRFLASFCYGFSGTSDSRNGLPLGWYGILNDPSSVVIDYFH